MISTSALTVLKLVLFALTRPFLLLHDVSIPAGVAAATVQVGASLALIYKVIPTSIAALLVVVGIVITFDKSHFGYKLIKWAYQKIPGIN